MKREREFYKGRNIPCPKDVPQVLENDEALDKLNEAHQETDYHRQDEQVNVCLECISNNLKHLKRRFIRCSSQATITHLKKFIAKKVLNGMDKYRDVSNQSELNYYSFNNFTFRLIFCAMMSYWGKIIH
jgi:polycomb group RING finger protein 3